MTSHRLLARLHKDLSELFNEPYPGVAVFPSEKNFRELCLVLTPPSGPWKDLSLHFAVTLPEDWPSSPPSVLSSVSGIDHPNLFGSYICCDLLKPHYETNYTGGYSPALTLRGLCLQFLTFFSSTKVEQDYGAVYDIGDATNVVYREDKDVVERLASSGRFPTSVASESDENQRRLEKIWTQSSGALVKHAAYGDSNPLTHTSRMTSAGRIHRFERRNPRWETTYNRIKGWSCTNCPYGSTTLPHSSTASSHPTAMQLDIVTPPLCYIDTLNDDCLFEISQHLASETIISFSRAYPRFARIVETYHLLLRSQLQCFFLRTPLHESMLGVGVHLEPSSRTLSSDFDWLSKEAFDMYGVRKSVQKRSFQFWLPLAFNGPHFDKASREVWRRLAEISEAVEEADKANKQRRQNGHGAPVAVRPTRPVVVVQKPSSELVGVVFKLMNNIVVALMQSCNDEFQGVNKTEIRTSPYATQRRRNNLLHASEKAIISYCHLFHLVASLCRSNPTSTLQPFTLRLRAFVTTPNTRLKSRTPDLGELIVMLSIVSTLPSFDGKMAMTWDKIAGVLLQEAITRNARWILKASPELEVMEDQYAGVVGQDPESQGPLNSEYRLKTSFSASKTSLRLLMFQSTFLNLFGRTYGPDSASTSQGSAGIQKLDDNYGFPEDGLAEKMVEEIKAIYTVSSWREFFRRVRFEQGAAWSDAKFSGMLRDAMKTSAERGYHEPTKGVRFSELVRKRKLLDSSFGKRQAVEESGGWRRRGE